MLNNKAQIDNIARGIYNAFAEYKNKYDTGMVVPFKTTSEQLPETVNTRSGGNSKDNNIVINSPDDNAANNTISKNAGKTQSNNTANNAANRNNAANSTTGNAPKQAVNNVKDNSCLLYTSPSPRD